MKKVSEVLHYTEKQQKASLSKTMPLAMEVRYLHLVLSYVCVAFLSTKLIFFYSIKLAILANIKSFKDHEYYILFI